MVTAHEVARRAHFEAEALVHLDALYSFALKLARARDDAEDLVSDTILRAFERWEQYRRGTNIRAWLFTILYHAFVSRKRRIDAREVRIPEDEDGRGAYEIVGEAEPGGKFYDSFLDDEITRGIDALPEGYRLAGVLSAVQGLRYAHSAGHLRSSIAAAGLTLRLLDSASSRHESGAPVPGLVAVAAKHHG